MSNPNSVDEGIHVESGLGRCPTDASGEFEWRLEFRRRMLRMRGRTADGDPFDIRPRAKEKITGGMRVEDIWGLCPPEEFEGFEEWLREFRRRCAPEVPQQ